MGFKLTASSGGGDFEVVPAGNHPAVLVSIIDLGTHEETFNGKKKKQHKVHLTWELPDEKKANGESHVIGREYTQSLNEKAAMRAMIEAWFDKPLKDNEVFDITVLLGRACMVSVLNEEKNGKTYSKIKSIGSIPKQMPKPKATIKPIKFDIEEDDLASFPTEEWLPWSYGSKLIDLAKLSPEWQEKLTGKKTAQPSQGQPVGVGAAPDEDEAPF